jgi:hypothetical protein
MSAIAVVLAGCSSGSVREVRSDQARDAGLPDQVAAVQATRVVERYFPPTGTPAPTVPAPPALGDLVITFGFRADGTPDGSYASVPAGVGTAYAAARLSGVSVGQVIRGVVIDAWGNEIAAPEITIDPGAADRWLALPIALPAEVPPGEYGVYVFADERALGSLAFGVTSVGSSAQLLPDLPVNPQVRSTLPPPGMAPVEANPTPTLAPQG